MEVIVDPPMHTYIPDALPEVVKEEKPSFSLFFGEHGISVVSGTTYYPAKVTTINFTPVIAMQDEGIIRAFPVSQLSESDRLRFATYVSQEKIHTLRRTAFAA